MKKIYYYEKQCTESTLNKSWQYLYYIGLLLKFLYLEGFKDIKCEYNRIYLKRDKCNYIFYVSFKNNIFYVHEMLASHLSLEINKNYLKINEVTNLTQTHLKSKELFNEENFQYAVKRIIKKINSKRRKK